MPTISIAPIWPVGRLADHMRCSSARQRGRNILPYFSLRKVPSQIFTFRRKHAKQSVCARTVCIKIDLFPDAYYPISNPIWML